MRQKHRSLPTLLSPAFAALILCSLLPLLASCNGGSSDLENDIGQMIMVGFTGLTLDEAGPLEDQIQQGMVGGVILFSRDVRLSSDIRNIQSADQVRTLVGQLQHAAESAGHKKLLVAVDQEGGKVARFSPKHGFPDSPSAKELGQALPEDAYLAGEQAGGLLQDMGLNINLAPVVDVNVNPDNPAIGKLGRSFSSDPTQVSIYAEAFANGVASAGVLPCAKHFPGHGSAYNDSHLGITDITTTWSDSELIPYQDFIRNETVPMIMTGHLFHAGLDPEYPSTLSYPTLTGLLRDTLGFDGVIITDDMQMRAIADHYGLEHAVVLAVEAGADILLFGNNLDYDPYIPEKIIDALTAAVDEGTISADRIREAAHRVRKLKNSLQ